MTVEDKNKLSRRDFLKLASSGVAYSLTPKLIKEGSSTEKLPETGWPQLETQKLPEGKAKEILSLVPDVEVDRQGNLTANGQRLPFAETQWSKENRTPINPDALTVHYSSDPEPENKTVLGVISGYDQIRTRNSVEFQTSAHATIGVHPIEKGGPEAENTDKISILQTQRPDSGQPTISSHIRSNLRSESNEFENRKHPINALERMVELYDMDDNYCYLFDVLDNYNYDDVNLRTISLELLGSNFDSDEGHPPAQLIANTVGVILAYMKKYPDIDFSNITGHHEIQMDKGDPGKLFMAELRLLLALKVLETENENLKENFFSPFIKEGDSKKEAIKRFFDFHWDYLVNSKWGRPKDVHRWEESTNYWNIYQSMFPEVAIPVADNFTLPVTPHGEKRLVLGNGFALPENHEGVDLNIQKTRRVINEDLGENIASIANGKVIFADAVPGLPGLGNTTVIEHITKDGTKIHSLYAHLDDFVARKGDIVEAGEKIATMGNSGGYPDSHLHFAIFPAATKREREFSHYLQRKYAGQETTPETEIESGRIYIVPQSTKESEIFTYYFSPIQYIEERSEEKTPEVNNPMSSIERKLSRHLPE